MLLTAMQASCLCPKLLCLHSQLYRIHLITCSHLRAVPFFILGKSKTNEVAFGHFVLLYCYFHPVQLCWVCAPAEGESMEVVI